MNAFEKVITKQIEDLYNLNEQDVELFSKVTEDGNLIVDEQGIIAFRIYRLNSLFDHFDNVLKNEPPIKMIKFIDILITFINDKMSHLGGTDLDIMEKSGFYHIASKMRERFNELIKSFED
jgi:hypothetical protein